MQLSKTRAAMNAFGKYVVENSKQNLVDKGKNSSSSLYESISYKISEGGDFTGLEILMEEYGKFQDKGVSGVKVKYETPYAYTDKMPPPTKLDKWIVRRGIAPRTSSGKFKARTISAAGFAKSIQFMIARSIYMKGIKPSMFFTKPFEAAFKNLPEEMINAFALDVEQLMKNTIKNK
tara:strand:- start:70 stop:600 length:531 start_codon:yes stop_codon:yes gene_type:complete